MLQQLNRTIEILRGKTHVSEKVTGGFVLIFK